VFAGEENEEPPLVLGEVYPLKWWVCDKLGQIEEILQVWKKYGEIAAIKTELRLERQYSYETREQVCGLVLGRLRILEKTPLEEIRNPDLYILTNGETRMFTVVKVSLVSDSSYREYYAYSHLTVMTKEEYRKYLVQISGRDT